ncbi:FHA domain-containing protein [Sorangium sp. So ce1000]|uniref:FHA domain-containing protein n=1 Tax=Sorangium sp. So ce1000 TaxID=3133325 RepID=UPI003F63EAC2
MWKLTIEDDEGKQTGLPLAHEEYSLGRGESNSIRLTDRNVSRTHATLAKNSQGWVIRDLDSYNGTYVNGGRVNGEQHLRHGDLVQLGDYRIEIVDEALSSAVTSPMPPPGSRSTAHLPLHTRPNRLVMVVGPTPGAEFPLDGERFTIGRSEDATISINHSSVSRLHAELISLGNGRYEVVDKQSANGVRINGVELKRGLLEAGDALELGDVRLRFVAAGKIFRAGPEGAPGTTAPGVYGSVAPSAPSSRSLGGASKAMGLLLAVALIVAIAVVAVTRARSHGSTSPEPEPRPAAPALGSNDAQILDAAQELFRSGDIDAAHRKLQEIAETSPVRETPRFKEIEERWAEGMFQQVEQAGTKAEKLALLNEIAKTTGVPTALRARVAEMRRQVDPEAPPEPEPVVPHLGAPPSWAAQPAPAPTPTPTATATATASAAASAPTASASGTAPTSSALDSSSYPAQRRALEPKVWSGKASASEIKLLRAICIHQGDAVCRDKATAALDKLEKRGAEKGL